MHTPPPILPPSILSTPCTPPCRPPPPPPPRTCVSASHAAAIAYNNARRLVCCMSHVTPKIRCPCRRLPSIYPPPLHPSWSPSPHTYLCVCEPCCCHCVECWCAAPERLQCGRHEALNEEQLGSRHAHLAGIARGADGDACSSLLLTLWCGRQVGVRTTAKAKQQQQEQ